VSFGFWLVAHVWPTGDRHWADLAVAFLMSIAAGGFASAFASWRGRRMVEPIGAGLAADVDQTGPPA
jgi:hypothetical protein